MSALLENLRHVHVEVSNNHRPTPEPETRTQRATRYVAAATRLSLGTVFGWAFLDKLFGLGHETASSAAWIRGGHPTGGFLKFAAAGPLKGFYNSFAGAAWADWLFMLALGGIAIALLFGIGMRIATASGVVLLVMMFSAVLPPANHIFMDDHIIYALVLVLLTLVGAGKTFGFGKAWEKLPIVAKYPILK